MSKHIAVSIATTLALLSPMAATAATDAGLAQIHEQIKQIKEDYEARIQALEKRLQKTEAKADKAEDVAAQAENTASIATSRPASENAFNPGVSLILHGTYNNLSQDPVNFQITGFMPTGGEVAPETRGFSLSESELVVEANIDDKFRGVGIFAFAPDDTIAVEEAYFQTLGLSNGLTIKGGRFFSGVGYLNEMHQHAWDFVDAPLPYKAFLGGQMGDDGVQVKWIAPTDTLVELGAEIGKGRSFPGTDRNKNGSSSGAVFAHIGGDIGPGRSYRAGISYHRTSPEGREYDDTDSIGNSVTNSFTGDSKFWMTDFVFKWAPNGNPTHTNFKLQGEYIRATEDGILNFDINGASTVLAGPAPVSYSTKQSGWYLQGVYQFAPQWRAGLRYDRLNFGTVNISSDVSATLTGADFPIFTPHDPDRTTIMFDYSRSEFSRFRLQFASDKSRLGASDDQVFLQYIYSLGAHRAHKY